MEDVDIGKCHVTGRGIQARGVRIGDEATFEVDTRGAGRQAQLDVSVTRPGSDDVEESVVVEEVSFLFSIGLCR